MLTLILPFYTRLRRPGFAFSFASFVPFSLPHFSSAHFLLLQTSFQETAKSGDKAIFIIIYRQITHV